MKTSGSMKKNRMIADIGVHALLTIMAIIWLFPIFWIILISFRGDTGVGAFTTYFWPKVYTVDNYVSLFTDTSVFQFGQWFMNTLYVAIVSCILSTFFVLCISYTFSRLRFKTRKGFMNVGLILGMFPGFMSMIAVYHVLDTVHLTRSLEGLILVYSAGQCMQYFIAKGFFDTIPKAVDEAAWIDGATKFQVFTRITIPLSKPIVVYTVLTAFMAPWIDFIFASFFLGTERDKYTVAVGLWNMVQRDYLNTYFTRFAAGAVIVSIPIALVFIVMQRYYVEGLASGAVKG